VDQAVTVDDGTCTAARAVVHAGGRGTEYVRAGRGPALVLVSADLDSADVIATVKMLAAGFLVFAAAPALTAPEELHPWLLGFLEGLGVARAHLMLHASVAPTLLTGEIN
jgi:hypothetical protein